MTKQIIQIASVAVAIGFLWGCIGAILNAVSTAPEWKAISIAIVGGVATWIFVSTTFIVSGKGGDAKQE